MVGIGFAMIGLAVLAWLLRRRGSLYESKWFHRFALAMGRPASCRCSPAG
jgi:cytochrome d ubiquinol oxidase subunit I